MLSIYIKTITTERIGLAIEDHIVKELVIDRPSTKNQVGNIFVAKVAKVEKGLQAAFIDIGQEKHGFLQKKELPQSHANKNVGIESLITEGQRIIVQIQKDAYGDKGARLTANITIAGKDIVYLPFGNYIASSRKLFEKDRENLRHQVKNMTVGEEGAIIRTSAKNKTNHEIEAEFLSLRRRWEDINQRSKKQSIPSCVYLDDPLLDRFIGRFDPKSIHSIFIDDVQAANNVRKRFPEYTDCVTWHKNIENLLPKSVGQIMEEVINPSVQATGGVELQVDQTEALTVIDVNTKAFTGKVDKSQTIVTANCYAARAVAHQLRLRNISGIIIIDFIGMKLQKDRDQVLAELKKELKDDPILSDVYGFTKLGLLEMTRKRESQPVYEFLLEKTSKQPQLSVNSYAYLLEHDLVSYQDSKAEALLIEINPILYDIFKSEINFEKIKTFISPNIYFNKTNEVSSYQVKLLGSKQLIEEYLESVSMDTIDKSL
ncbi:ribonuclease E/G [Aquibacillus rhizosphaerae]|uniref:Ribonuclease E/G n=1 Tax=Aquibacillus rhizosphaerae TaxID=3051431 RepID=A0ABT7LAS9_9BACI|nr:ribonuclease E/G [Aquibacillus sp. LR5S19]MDL4841660.1 ribonuclease E/G [Aquibacillus sp. LR5S19]